MHRQYSFGRRIFPTCSLQPLLRSLVSTARFRRNEYFTYSCRWLWCFPPQKTTRGKQCPSPLTWFFSPQKCKISVYIFVSSFHLCVRFDAFCDSTLNTKQFYIRRMTTREEPIYLYQIRWVKPTSKRFLSDFVKLRFASIEFLMNVKSTSRTRNGHPT